MSATTRTGLKGLVISPYPFSGGSRGLDDHQGEPSFPASETDRVEHTRMRRRMLYGLARPDFRRKVLARLRSVERAEAWGDPDMTGNLFASACRGLAQLYTPDLPRVRGPSAADAVIEAAASGGLWNLLIRGQRDTIGLRQWLVRVEAVDDPASLLGKGLAYRPAYPDRCVCRPRADAPDLPAYVAEAVYSQRRGDPSPRWYWEIWSTDEGVPYYELRTTLDKGAPALERLDGPAYPYWDRSGPTPIPVVPYSLYHAERTGYLWDPWEWIEAVEGSLELVTQLTFFGHVLLKAAWPQRYSIGVEWGGSSVEEAVDDGTPARARTSIPADPAVVLVGYPAEDASGALTGQPVVGEWEIGADPRAIMEAITAYARWLGAVMGLDPGQILRVDGDPRSGYAIKLSREQQAEARARFRPQFERGDAETMRVSACVLGSAAGVVLPTRGYSFAYGPLSAAEIGEAVGTGRMTLEEGVSRLIRDHGFSESGAIKVLEVRNVGANRPLGGRGEDQDPSGGEGRGEGGGGGAQNPPRRDDRGDGPPEGAGGDLPEGGGGVGA